MATSLRLRANVLLSPLRFMDNVGILRKSGGGATSYSDQSDLIRLLLQEGLALQPRQFGAMYPHCRYNQASSANSGMSGRQARVGCNSRAPCVLAR